MDTFIKRNYSEVYEILNMLGNYYIEKLPKKLYSLIENERDRDYTPQYDSNMSIATQNITKIRNYCRRYSKFK